MSWKCFKELGIVHTPGGLLFRIDALPFLIDDQGEIKGVGTQYSAGAPAFASDRQAFLYMLSLAQRDLQYRGMRDDRISCFQYKQDANFLLYRNVRECDNAVLYECLRQKWKYTNRAQYRDHKWSPEQQEAIAKRQDVVKQSWFWDYHCPNEGLALSESIWEQMFELLDKTNMRHLAGQVKNMLQACDRSKGQPQHVENYADVPEPAEQCIAVSLDKNPKCKAFVGMTSYYFIH